MDNALAWYFDPEKSGEYRDYIKVQMQDFPHAPLRLWSGWTVVPNFGSFYYFIPYMVHNHPNPRSFSSLRSWI